ncbi:MAG: hypothetical protein ACI8RZ_004556 [Myxococcota bacterium]|jgi:hypothetical protein
MSISRRGLGGLIAGGMLVPGALLAGSASSERKFLFVFCVGGWDPTWVFANLLGSKDVDTDPTAQPGVVGGLSFVDSAARPAVRSFFESYADRCCILNGIEVRSITHEACRRIILTGGTAGLADDWPAIIAGTSSGFTLPDLVLSGPAYTAQYTGSVMRVGPDGQLGKLLSGEALSSSDLTAETLSESANASIEAFLRERSAAAQVGTSGQPARFLSDYDTALGQLDAIRALSGQLDLSVDGSGYVTVQERAVPALDCFELGLTRCGVIEHAGEWDIGWDSHSGIDQQGAHFEVLFDDLAGILADLSQRTGSQGGSLLDEVTVVVLSEMGRAPQLNVTGGKDHWTYTSAMLIGAGVSGGRIIGGYDDQLLGRPVDLRSGSVTDSGTGLTAANLGATLLAMADIDPAEFTEAEPIAAAMSGD